MEASMRTKQTILSAALSSFSYQWLRHSMISARWRIDDKILNKPGRLTKREFEIMKTHSAIGAHMLESQSSSVTSHS